MPHSEDSYLSGRHLERKITREDIFDPTTGEKFTAEFRLETAEAFDGTIEAVEHVALPLLACGHPHRIGEAVSVCSPCSREAKRTAFVCKACEVICPVLSEPCCRRHSVLGPDGKRYSPDGLRTAKRMGLFDSPATGAGILDVGPARAKQSFLARILEWW